MRAGSRSEEHVGEWKLTLWADSLEELFAEAARVVARKCGRRAATGSGSAGWEAVRLEGRDTATLLVDWLNELLGRSEVRGQAYAQVRNLRVQEGSLTAEVRGWPVECWLSPIKAATYHGLALRQERGRWKAEVLFDV